MFSPPPGTELTFKSTAVGCVATACTERVPLQPHHHRKGVKAQRRHAPRSLLPALHSKHDIKLGLSFAGPRAAPSHRATMASPQAKTQNETAALLSTLGSCFPHKSINIKDAHKGRAKTRSGEVRLSGSARQHPALSQYCSSASHLLTHFFPREYLSMSYNLTGVETLINICKLFLYPQVRGATQICDIIQELPLCLNSFSSAEKKKLLSE